MLMEPTPRPRASFSTLILAALAVAGAALLAPRVLAEGPGQGVFIQRRLGGADDPLAPHQAEIRACYDQARQETPDLVVDTVAEFSLDGDWKVISASVPTPASPIFQRCMEQKALGWTFPPPAHLPPPPKDLPRDAKRLLALRVELRP